MNRRIAFPILMVTLLCAAPGRAADDVNALVARAGEVFARDVKGVLGFRQITDNKLKASILNQHTHTESWQVSKDGVPQQVRILLMQRDGKPVKASEMSEEERKINEANRQAKSLPKLPFDPRHMDAYAFTDGGPCTDCEPGTRLVRFTSSLKDEQHGTGTMRIDARYRITAFDFTPNALPANVNEGRLRFVRAEVLPGTFATRTIEGDFKGGQAFVRGTVKLEERREGYQRFKSLEEALNYQP